MPQFKYVASGSYVIASDGTGVGPVGYQVSVTSRGWTGSVVFAQNIAPPGSVPNYVNVAYQDANTGTEFAAGTAITGTAAVIISPTVGDLIAVVTVTTGEVIINVNPATQGVTNRELRNAFVAAGYDTAGQDTTEAMLSVAVAGMLGQVLDVRAFGAKGDGVTDDTAAIQDAIDAAVAQGFPLEISNGTFLVDTFGNTLDDTTLAAFLVTGNLEVRGNGTITSTTAQTSRVIFGADGTSGAIDLTIRGIKFAGNTRYRAVSVTPSAELNSLCIEDVTTARQSFILVGDVIRSIVVRRNKVGNGITAATAVGPSINVTIVAGSTNQPFFDVSQNVVWTGTEVISTGAYVIHNMPTGGMFNYNVHNNVGNADIEGFDIDIIGRFCQVIGNTGYQSSFEYKVGTGGYSESRDIIFAFNTSYNSPSQAFSIRSSCIGVGNVAYNPAVYGLFMTPGADSDNLLDSSHVILSGFRIIYAGATPWTAAVKIDEGFASYTFSDLRIELDPAWNEANPGSSLPGVQINIDGDVNNLTMTDVFIDRSAGNQIEMRPDTTATNVRFTNVRFGTAGDSCFDLANITGLVIENPVFPASITDRPIRLATCSAVRITSDFQSIITLAQTSGTNTGVLINNWGQGAFGAATPPTAGSEFPIGAIVTNTSDAGVWLRVSASATPATAWKLIA